ncbi:MAG: NapC/NirT family cytochrome c [Actinomycetota bacterium]
MSEPAEPTNPPEAPDAPVDEAVGPKRRFRHVRAPFAPLGRVLHKIPHPPWRSKRGILLLFVLFGGFGAAATMGGVTAVGFSETPGFCGMCHTMDPELKAYAMSPHRDVTCAECHVEPGAAGFIKAKANGTKQLFDIITGKFPTPIEPPDHAKLPAVKDTCLKCHSLDGLTENGGPVKLVLRRQYLPDKTNTQQTVAVMLRPGGLGEVSGVQGVHWHVAQKVTYTTSDIRSRKIDLIEVTEKDGAIKQYISSKQVAVSSDVKTDVDRLKTSETTRRMDCIDCHNRIGHGIPSPDQTIDEAMAAGKISASLPFIKRDSLALLNGDYPTLQAADKAIEGLQSTYETKYPLVAKDQAEKVTAAIDELKTEYRLIATPAMKVQAKTYPDNLGHQSSLGCFRCHDGGHYLVDKGKITNKTIPSECSTCHTFPQVSGSASRFPLEKKPAAESSLASAIANIPLGAKPADHKDKLYVFSHKNSVNSTEATGTSCAACHTPSYCENCHDSGAIKVKHDKMLYNHADVAAKAGGTQSCNYCHQPVSCAQCHKDPVLNSAAPATAAKRPAALINAPPKAIKPRLTP